MADVTKKPLFVVVPRAVAKTKAGAMRDLFAGDVVADDISPESVKHLTDLGFVSETSPHEGTK